MVIDRCIADIHIELENESGLRVYDLWRIFTNSHDAALAPECDITASPKLSLSLGYGDGTSKKVGIMARLHYYGSLVSFDSFDPDDDATVVSPVFPNVFNNFSCMHGDRELEAIVTLKNEKGEIVKTIKKPVAELRGSLSLKKYVRRSSRKKKTYDKSNFDYTYNCMVNKPEGGGIVEISVDTGPMFGVLTDSRKLQ